MTNALTVLLKNRQIPDNATFTATVGELRSFVVTVGIDEERLALAAREFIEDHDEDHDSDETWPCTGRCAQADRLRAAIAKAYREDSDATD